MAPVASGPEALGAVLPLASKAEAGEVSQFVTLKSGATFPKAASPQSVALLPQVSYGLRLACKALKRGVRGRPRASAGKSTTTTRRSGSPCRRSRWATGTSSPPPWR